MNQNEDIRGDKQRRKEQLKAGPIKAADVSDEDAARKLVRAVFFVTDGVSMAAELTQFFMCFGLWGSRLSFIIPPCISKCGKGSLSLSHF